MKSRNVTIYPGIQILRMIFSFNIVVLHCIRNKRENLFIYFISSYAAIYYVPTFFLISFYFSYKTFVSKNIFKLKERLLRILVPYIIWPFIFWMKNFFLNIINGIEDNNKYKRLFYQLLLGKPVNPVFWFHFCLIFYNILLIIIILMFNKIYKYIMTILLILILYLNYSGYTDSFINHNFSTVAISVYDLFYRIIYAFSGFYFGSINVLNYKFSYISKIILISFLGFIFTRSFKDKTNLGYIHVQLVINIIFLFTSLIPSFLLKNKIIISKIIHLASYTGGIYYLHYEFKRKPLNKIYLIKKANLFSCVFIYFICYLFCFLSFKIFKNTKFKYLFV